MKFGAHHVYMDDLAGAAGGGAAADPGAAAGADAAAGAAGAQPGAASGAGAGGDAGGAAQGGSGSALSAGVDWSPSSVPEKLRVLGADGELDVTATFRKVDEHRASLEKRMGEGGIRPKSADEYKLPETDAFKNLQLDETAAKDFKTKAHAMGLSQSQYEGIMSEWATLAPGLVEAGAKQTTESAVAALKDAWKDDFAPQMQGAVRAITTVAKEAGISFEDAEQAIGNNPIAIRMFASLSKQMGEDRTPSAANGGSPAGASTYDAYIAENFAAYSNPRDPKHAEVTARASQLAAREFKDPA